MMNYDNSLPPHPEHSNVTVPLFSSHDLKTMYNIQIVFTTN